MRPSSKPPATYEDLKRVSDDKLAQIVDGELVVSPRPAIPHQHVLSTLGMDLGPPFQRGRGGPGGWWFLDEPELHFGPDVLVPDIAGWRRERFPVLPTGPFLTLAPDWLCEILSPSTAGLDRVRKMSIYRRVGVTHVWLIDPVGRSLEIFRADGDAWKRVSSSEGEDIARAEPFDAIELTLADLWLPNPETP